MGQCQLILRFTRHPSAELYRIEFTDELGTVVHAYRGKSDGVHAGAATFQWTSAVRALASLALRTKLRGSEIEVLSGERGSPASALDFALGKPPRWLTELFSRRGQRHLRYFRRSNPELKQPGPVEISFNPAYLRGSEIEIYLADRQVTSEGDLSQLLASIDPTFDGASAAQGESAAELTVERSAMGTRPDAFDVRAYLRQIFAEEAHNSLSRIKVSSSGWCRNQLAQLADDALFKRITVNPTAVAAQLAPPSSSLERFGIHNRSALAESFTQPIRIFATNCQPGFISIVTYLRDYLKLPLMLDSLHLYGVELARRVIKEGESDIPTLISLGLGPSAPFLNDPRHGYSPLMLGPALNHRIVTSNAASKRRRHDVGELLMVSDEVTSAMFSLASFKRSSARFRRTSPQHVEPDEVMEHLVRGEEMSSLLWFPHNRFFPELLGGDSHATAEDEPYVDITMLLGNTALTSAEANVRSLLGALRHGWLLLLEQPAVLNEIAERVMGDEVFYRYTRRALGLQHLGGQGTRFAASLAELRGAAA